MIGCPRSGTSFLTQLVGKNTDLVFDEPGDDPMYERGQVAKWEFPDCDSVVFKWCENFNVAEQILARFPTSYFLHTVRDPCNNVYSIAFPKAGSYPPRQFAEISNASIAERVRGSIEKWQWYVTGCLRVGEIAGPRCLTIAYDRMPAFYEEIEQLTGIRLVNQLDFRDRDLKRGTFSDLDRYWEEMPSARILRRDVEQLMAALRPHRRPELILRRGTEPA